jgi:hypothetical protein
MASGRVIQATQVTTVPHAPGCRFFHMAPRDILATRVANALIQDATSPIENLVGAVGRSTRRYRQRHGGLWVGGRLTLTSAELSFVPNAANRLVHDGDPSVAIPLSAIRQVDIEPGVVTKIVAVTWTGGVARFRCYKAAIFADQIRAAAG